MILPVGKNPPKLPPNVQLSDYVSHSISGLTNERYRGVLHLLREFPLLVSQLESCGYVCEAGNLEANAAFQRMQELARMIRS